jgi:tight adherence protein B
VIALVAAAAAGACVAAIAAGDARRRLPRRGKPASATTAAAVVQAIALRCTARRRRSDREADVVRLTYALAAELRAGRPPGDALAATAQHLPVLGPQVAAAGRAISRGAAVGAELEALADTCDSRRLRSVAAAWAATARVGAGAADLLDRLGESFDADDRAAGELAAAAAGPKATMVVLAVLPLLGLMLGTATGLAPLHVLLHSRAGWALAVTAAAFDLAGLLWVRRITATALTT